MTAKDKYNQRVSRLHKVISRMGKAMDKLDREEKAAQRYIDQRSTDSTFYALRSDAVAAFIERLHTLGIYGAKVIDGYTYNYNGFRFAKAKKIYTVTF